MLFKGPRNSTKGLETVHTLAPQCVATRKRSRARHSGTAVDSSSGNICQELAEHAALVLEAGAVVLGAASAIFGSLEGAQEAGVLDVEIAEQGVDLTRACHTGLLDLMLVRQPRLLLLLLYLFLLPPDGRQLFVVLELALQTIHHVLLLDALYLFVAVLAQPLVLLEVQSLQVAFNDPDCPAYEARQLLLK